MRSGVATVYVAYNELALITGKTHNIMVTIPT